MRIKSMNRQSRLFLTSGAVSALLAVALGAFGSHGLENRLSADLLAIYEIGNRYHFYHSFALLAVGVLALHVDGRRLSASGWCFLVGLTVFSGSLYALAMTGMRILGAITPIGGGLLIIAWALLAFEAYATASSPADD
ncbi:MAG: DUF423 domain-containing protein [Pseudomonadota bacterium]